MRIKDIRKAAKYLVRIAKDPFSIQSRTALQRYIREVFVLLREKIQGLDFTMVYQCSGNEHNNNYSKTPDRVLKSVFAQIDFNQPHRFLDVGCGKGYVVSKAAEWPFECVGGVEYTKELCKICERNLKILGLGGGKIEIYNCDAKDFDGYGDYDIFYFCNPFDETVLSEVARKIYRTHIDRPCTLYYLNPHQEARQKAVMDAGFRLVRLLKDHKEGYFDVNVYRP